MWKAVLRLGETLPSITTSFVDLGGDSLAATLCMSRLRNIFGPDLDIDLSDFFDDKATVKNFAEGIDSCNSTQL